MDDATNDCAESEMWAESLVDLLSSFSITTNTKYDARYITLFLEHISPMLFPCPRIERVQF